jgi:hypothetical protein
MHDAFKPLLYGDVSNSNKIQNDLTGWTMMNNFTNDSTHYFCNKYNHQNIKSIPSTCQTCFENINLLTDVVCEQCSFVCCKPCYHVWCSKYTNTNDTEIIKCPVCKQNDFYSETVQDLQTYAKTANVNEIDISDDNDFDNDNINTNPVNKEFVNLLCDKSSLLTNFHQVFFTVIAGNYKCPSHLFHVLNALCRNQMFSLDEIKYITLQITRRPQLKELMSVFNSIISACPSHELKNIFTLPIIQTFIAVNYGHFHNPNNTYFKVFIALLKSNLFTNEFTKTSLFPKIISQINHDKQQIRLKGFSVLREIVYYDPYLLATIVSTPISIELLESFETILTNLTTPVGISMDVLMIMKNVCYCLLLNSSEKLNECVTSVNFMLSKPHLAKFILTIPQAHKVITICLHTVALTNDYEKLYNMQEMIMPQTEITYYDHLCSNIDSISKSNIVTREANNALSTLAFLIGGAFKLCNNAKFKTRQKQFYQKYKNELFTCLEIKKSLTMQCEPWCGEVMQNATWLLGQLQWHNIVPVSEFTPERIDLILQQIDESNSMKYVLRSAVVDSAYVFFDLLIGITFKTTPYNAVYLCQHPLFFKNIIRFLSHDYNVLLNIIINLCVYTAARNLIMQNTELINALTPYAFNEHLKVSTKPITWQQGLCMLLLFDLVEMTPARILNFSNTMCKFITDSKIPLKIDFIELLIERLTLALQMKCINVDLATTTKIQSLKGFNATKFGPLVDAFMAVQQ